MNRRPHECNSCKKTTRNAKSQIRVELPEGSYGIDLTFSGYYCKKCLEKFRAGVPSARNTRLVLV